MRDAEASPEEIALVWIDCLLSRPADERLATLSDLLAADAERCGTVLRVEWHSGDLGGDPRLVALGRRHFDPFPPPWLEFPCRTPLAGGAATDAWVAAVDGTGHLVVILTRPSRSGRNTFAVLLLDLWHHGVEDIWGNARAEDQTLGAVLSHFASMRPQVTWRRLRAAHACALVRRAHRLNELHSRLLPPEFWVWCDLFASPTRS